ncbi:hypothetical protein [Buchananella hordeovulneris]|uniref:hypothetical protein n=1 Tax=Buchananella hordeovulneris TaxID=52770 RepID=UPI0026DB0F6D|nr:hypothetical protein [Buchananella hordeovulneris]MDO5080666.1 hypothetical protein [Buchananella hordeovulneris]
MTYGPGPTPPEGYDPAQQYGYPPAGGQPPVAYPPTAPIGGYPQSPYGPESAGDLPPGMPGPGGMQPVSPTGYGAYPGGPGYPSPPNNGLKVALIAVASALVLGGAGLGTFFLLKDDAPAAATETTASPAPSTQPGEQQPQDEQTPVPAADNGGGAVDARYLLPTSAVFVPVPGELLPEELEGHELKLTDTSTDYRRSGKGELSNFSLDWARVKADKVGTILEYLDNQKEFGEVRCAQSAKSSVCIAEHPHHPDIWLKVRSFEGSPEQTVDFVRKVIELWK